MRLVDRDVGEVGQQPGAAVGRDPRGAQGGTLVDERGREPAGLEVGLLQQRLEERDVGRDAADAELGQGAPGPTHRGGEVAATAGQLDQHRVEVRPDLGAHEHGATVETDPGPTGRAVGRDPAGVGAELVGRVLGGDAALEGGPADLQGLLRQPEVGEGLAAGDPQLRADQVDVGDLLGDGVLDLDPRVHLDEDVAAVGGEQELDGAGVDVADLLGEGDRVGAHPLAQLGVEVGGGGDLDDLLVASLDRAVPLEQVDDVALAVREDLHLDVAGLDHGLLEEDGRVTERRLGLTHAGLEGLAQVLAALDPPHAAPATARDGLGEDGEADLLRGGHQGVDVGAGLGAVEGREPGLLGRRDGPCLVAGEVQDRGRRADEGDTGPGAGLGEVGVLGEEAVTRVDRVGTGLDGGPHDRLGVEVGADRVTLLPDAVGLVGLEDVLGLAVLVGEDGDRLGAELGGGAERADRDLTPVRDEDLAEHVTSRGSAPGGGGAGEVRRAWGTGGVSPSLVKSRRVRRPARDADGGEVSAGMHGSGRQFATVKRCRRWRGCSSSSTSATA